MNENIVHLPNGDFVVGNRRICMDCGKQWTLKGEDWPEKCPRCSSLYHIRYVEAQHEQLEIDVPDDYQHPMEQRAKVIFARVMAMTGWREQKVRLWFQLPNPLLGNVAPEVMIMAGEERCARLERFIDEAEELNNAWHRSQEKEPEKKWPHAVREGTTAPPSERGEQTPEAEERRQGERTAQPGAGEDDTG